MATIFPDFLITPRMLSLNTTVIQNFCEGFIFVDAKVMKIKPTQNDKITLSFTDVGKS